MAFTEDERRAFILGYTDTMKWANTYRDVRIPSDNGQPESDEWESESFDALHDIAVWLFDHDSMVRIEEVCDDFMRATEPMLRAGTMCNGPGNDFTQHGMDFALTQNGHGSGFWDRGYPYALGEALTEAAKAQGSADAIVHDEANGLLTYEG